MSPDEQLKKLEDLLAEINASDDENNGSNESELHIAEADSPNSVKSGASSIYEEDEKNGTPDTTSPGKLPVENTIKESSHDTYLEKSEKSPKYSVKPSLEHQKNQTAPEILFPKNETSEDGNNSSKITSDLIIESHTGDTTGVNKIVAEVAESHSQNTTETGSGIPNQVSNSSKKNRKSKKKKSKKSGQPAFNPARDPVTSDPSGIERKAPKPSEKVPDQSSNMSESNDNESFLSSSKPPHEESTDTAPNTSNLDKSSSNRTLLPLKEVTDSFTGKEGSSMEPKDVDEVKNLTDILSKAPKTENENDNGTVVSLAKNSNPKEKSPPADDTLIESNTDVSTSKEIELKAASEDNGTDSKDNSGNNGPIKPTDKSEEIPAMVSIGEDKASTHANNTQKDSKKAKDKTNKQIGSLYVDAVKTKDMAMMLAESKTEDENKIENEIEDKARKQIEDGNADDTSIKTENNETFATTDETSPKKTPSFKLTDNKPVNIGPQPIKDHAKSTEIESQQPNVEKLRLSEDAMYLDSDSKLNDNDSTPQNGSISAHKKTETKPETKTPTEDEVKDVVETEEVDTNESVDNNENSFGTEKSLYNALGTKECDVSQKHLSESEYTYKDGEMPGTETLVSHANPRIKTPENDAPSVNSPKIHDDEALLKPVSEPIGSEEKVQKESAKNPQDSSKPPVESQSLPKDDSNTVYLYVSLASGVRGTMSRYNKATTILKSYDIDFVPVEITLDERAKRLWKLKGVSKNKVLPAIFRDGDMKCDFNELIEANEVEDVEDLIFDGL